MQEMKKISKDERKNLRRFHPTPHGVGFLAARFVKIAVVILCPNSFVQVRFFKLCLILFSASAYIIQNLRQGCFPKVFVYPQPWVYKDMSSETNGLFVHSPSLSKSGMVWGPH